jgi:Concanavalin A-like lectin/glucanases superfamily
MHLRHAIFLLVLLGGLLVRLGGQTYADAVLSAAPVGYWRFETTSDASLVGSFTNSYFGNATVTTDGGGAPLTGLATNRALQLDGAGDYVRTGLDSEYTFADSATFMGWFNLSTLPDSAGRIFALVAKSQGGNDLDMQINTDNTLRFYTDGGSSTAYTFSPALATSTWYHFAVTFDDAGGGFRRLYVNGVFVAGQTGQAAHGTSGNELSIGESLVFTNRHFAGLIDEVAVFDRALTTTEIGNIYAAAAIPEPATFATWAGLLALGLGLHRRRSRTGSA